jgi:hypothetical protein
MSSTTNFFKLFEKSKFTLYRPDTPPNTPEHARNYFQNQERMNRVLESPEARRTPCPAIQYPIIPQLNFGPAVNVPIAHHVPVPEDPFQIPPPMPAPQQY